MFCISQGFRDLDTYRIIADIPTPKLEGHTQKYGF
jgi:hypothetical protein